MKKSILITGDILAILITTLVGFATHDELKSEFLLRFFTLFILLVGVWLFLAPRYGLYRSEITSNPKQLWRVLFVMIWVSFVAVCARNAILIFLNAFQSSDNNLIFIPVLAITSAIGLLLWRGIYYFLRLKP